SVWVNHWLMWSSRGEAIIASPWPVTKVNTLTRSFMAGCLQIGLPNNCRVGSATTTRASQATMNQASRGTRDNVRAMYRRTRRAALGGLVVTLGLGVAKLLGGWFGHSLALLSDSVHSLGDALSSASILVALWWAERPADREHPYGHTRIETIAASNVALLLLLSGLWVVWEALRAWNEPGPAPHGFTLVIALAAVGRNEAIYRYSIAVARRTGSRAVEASAWDQRLDVFGSLVVLIGLAVSRWRPDWHVVDHIAALLVAGIILWAGGTLFWSSLQDLMDR